MGTGRFVFLELGPMMDRGTDEDARQAASLRRDAHDAAEESLTETGMGFFRGLLFVLPLTILFWVVVWIIAT